MAAHWILACKELNGQIYVSRLPKSIPPSMSGQPPQPGIPSLWFLVGPGTRPSIQHYAGNASSFILTFEYLSHLVCRVISNIDETNGGTWPPTGVGPIPLPSVPLGPSDPAFTFSVAPSMNGPEDAIAFRVNSATAAPASPAYFFNPVQMDNSGLDFNPATNTWSVTLFPLSGWQPLVAASVTPFYRIYRRPEGSIPWTLVMDWNPTWAFVTPFTDTQVGGVFQFQYTATWGDLFDPNFPNDPTRHNEGVIGSGNILTFDTTLNSITFTFGTTDSIVWRKAQMNGYATVEAFPIFTPETFADVILLSQAKLAVTSSAYVAPEAISAFGFVAVNLSDDKIKLGAGPANVQSNAAPAGMN